MSQTSTAKATYQSKDGLWYTSYQDMCDANRQYNQRHLEQLGLGLAKTQAPTKRVFKPKPKQTVRRSARNKRKATSTSAVSDLVMVSPTNDNDHDYIDGVDHDNDSISKYEESIVSFLSYEPPARKRRQSVVSTALDVAQRQKLLHLHPTTNNNGGGGGWLKELHQFLLEIPHGGGKAAKTCSPENARSVMRQVRLLVAGLGVTYHHWPKGTVFLPNVAVTLDMDFAKMRDQAAKFEVQHGRDRGNGWLLQHPIRKLELFQQYRYQQLQQQEESQHESQQEEEESQEEEELQQQEESQQDDDKEGTSPRIPSQPSSPPPILPKQEDEWHSLEL